MREGEALEGVVDAVGVLGVRPCFASGDSGLGLALCGAMSGLLPLPSDRPKPSAVRRADGPLGVCGVLGGVALLDAEDGGRADLVFVAEESFVALVGRVATLLGE